MMAAPRTLDVPDVGAVATADDRAAFDAAILALWNKGQTQRLIARRLNITPHHVATVVDRARGAGLAVCRHADQSQRNGVVAILAGDRPAGPRLVFEVDPGLRRDHMISRDRPAVRLLDRGSARCAWVVGPIEGAATLCCGDAVSQGAYCAAHRRLAYRRAS